MICITYSQTAQFAGDLVYMAFCRAFSSNQVVAIDPLRLNELMPNINGPLLIVFIEPDATCVQIFNEIRHHHDSFKVMLLGKLPSALSKQLSMHTVPLPKDFADDASCESAPASTYRESRACIKYRRTLGLLASPISERALLRYDFRDEWNNLGYGAITVDDSVWALAQAVTVPSANLLAEVMSGTESISTYAALWDDDQASVLWFNRAVGPIDSQEWRLAEYFFASYRHMELPCVPVLSEIPYGYDAAVTMRLDCDEDIESSRALFDYYKAWNVPFSLAVHTALLSDARHTTIIQDVVAHQGAILSHSDTHPANWGGSYEAAYQEATESAAKLNAILGESYRVTYAVSPFHHTPSYALTALAKANYVGCVGGIVSSDQEFILARGGALHDCPPGFIGHTQSCMLHGDCLLRESDPIRIYKKAFDIAKHGRALFGFLDHPFSERYAYGWASEAARIKSHRQFIDYMRSQGNVLFLNEKDALDFVRFKSGIMLGVNAHGHISYHLPDNTSKQWEIAVEFCDRLVKLSNEGVPT